MVTTSRPAKCKRLIVLLLMTFATVQFIRSYLFINVPCLDEASYEAGTERMPYQGRILMAYLTRSVNHSPLVTRLAVHLRGPLHEPSTLVIAMVGLLSILIVAIVIHRWYLRLSPARLFPWLPFALFLWMIYSTYLARFQQAIYFPYDLLSVAFFTLTLFLSFVESYLLLAIVFCVACFNRETIIVILLPLCINAWLHLRSTPRRLPFREMVLCFIFVTVWVGIRLHYSHVFAHNRNDLQERFIDNLKFVEYPQTWSQILSGAGFLLPIPFLWLRSMPSLRMRLYSSLLLVWIAAMLVFGMLPESRIFGELTGFLAVYCALQFETFLLSSVTGSSGIAGGSALS